jgi:hypothetical protein
LRVIDKPIYISIIGDKRSLKNFLTKKKKIMAAITTNSCNKVKTEFSRKTVKGTSKTKGSKFYIRNNKSNEPGFEKLRRK